MSPNPAKRRTGIGMAPISRIAFLALLLADPVFADQLVYVALPQPCRLLDTRIGSGSGTPLTATNGPYLFGTDTTSISSAAQHGNSSGCGIPTGIEAVSVSMNMVNPTESGNIATWNADNGTSAPNIGTGVYNPSVTYNTGYSSIPVGAASGSNPGKFYLQVANGQIDMTINVVGYWRPVSWGETNGNPNAIALGYKTTSTGNASIALGVFANATGNNSTALGTETTASGNYSTATGYYTVASGPQSTAMGGVTTASGSYSTAMGAETTASGNFSTAMGFGTTANGNTSTAMGVWTYAGAPAGAPSTFHAIPNDAAVGDFSTALGFGTVSTGLVSTAMGYGTTASGNYSTAMGTYADVRAIDSGTFVWSDSTTTSSAPFTSTGANQFLINATGGVGIGTANIGTDGVTQAELTVQGPNTTRGTAMFCSTKGSLCSHVHYGNTGDWLIRSAQNTGSIFLQDAGGTVSVGNTASPSSAAIFLVGGNAAKPGGGAWAVLSDARLKQDITDIAHPLDRILSLHGVEFEYISGSHALESPGRQIGFIAQEVDRVFPDWVGTGSDGYEFVAVRGFEALAVEAMRQLREEKDAEIAQLKIDNAALKQQLDEISMRLSKIESTRDE